jgi:hypothetical protein
LNKNAVVGGTNQEILIDSTGFLARRFDTTLNEMSPEQLKITNNAMVLSDDGFVTAKTAIGRLINGMYGISAEIIAGKMILGNNLQIETSDGTFVVDENGVTISGMNLNMTSDDLLRNIIIDPNTGLKMRSRSSSGGNFVDNLYFGANGTIVARSLTIESDSVFKGTLSGADGNFSGDITGSNGTFTGTLSGVDGNFSGDITGSNGTFYGTLSGVDGTFSGTVSASSIVGGTITGNTSITGATINVTTNCTIGETLIINSLNENGYIEFSFGGGDRATISASKRYGTINLSSENGVWANGIRIDQPTVAKFA